MLTQHSYSHLCSRLLRSSPTDSSAPRFVGLRFVSRHVSTVLYDELLLSTHPERLRHLHSLSHRAELDGRLSSGLSHLRRLRLELSWVNETNFQPNRWPAAGHLESLRLRATFPFYRLTECINAVCSLVSTFTALRSLRIPEPIDWSTDQLVQLLQGCASRLRSLELSDRNYPAYTSAYSSPPFSRVFLDSFSSPTLLPLFVRGTLRKLRLHFAVDLNEVPRLQQLVELFPNLRCLSLVDCRLEDLSPLGALTNLVRCVLS